MSSIEESLLVGSRLEDDPQNSIIKAINQYGDRCESDQQVSSSEQQDSIFKGFENKRSLKIKPLNMFKDIITLKEENIDKKRKVRQLEELNEELRSKYDSCISHNEGLEHFFKEVEFTFQPERKKIHASEVMVRAKKNLCQEAKDSKERMKKMFRSNQTSAIQELNIYIATLQGEKQNLKGIVEKLSREVSDRLNIEDLNFIQARKFNEGCKNIRKTLDHEMKIVTARHQEYKVEKMVIKGKVKARHLEAEKKRYKEECQSTKALLLQMEGLQYEIGLLKHRVKDKKKETNEYDELLERIMFKESVTCRLEKELKQKYKTYEYMLEWSKQLKKQLEGKKSEHAKKKAEFEDQINNLTSEYQKYSQIYKAGLFEQQAAKRKGTREVNLPNQISKPVYRKLVMFEQIRIQVRSLSFYLLQNEIQTEQFISEVLRSTRKTQLDKDGRKIRLRTAFSLDKFQTKDGITVEQICSNFDSFHNQILTKDEYTKLAQFVVEDGSMEQKPSLDKKIATQIFRNLFKREIDNKQKLGHVQVGVKKLLKAHCDTIRSELKLSGGYEQEIEVSVIKGAIRRYGLDPYCCNIYAEFIQFFGWKRSKSIGYVKLEDYDELTNQLLRRSEIETTKGWQDYSNDE